MHLDPLKLSEERRIWTEMIGTYLMNMRVYEMDAKIEHICGDLQKFYPNENMLSSIGSLQDLCFWLEVHKSRDCWFREWFKENWLRTLIASVGAFLAGRYIISLDAKLVWQGICEFRTVCLQFCQKYLYEPVMEIWKTIRHSQGSLAVCSANTLKADLEARLLIHTFKLPIVTRTNDP